jgi:hypothetical protein
MKKFLMKHFYFFLLFILTTTSLFGQWNQIGGSVSSLSLNTAIIVDQGTPYVAYKSIINGNSLNVKKYDGSAWVQVGAANFTSSGINGVDMAFDPNGDLHVAYFEIGSGNISVEKFDGSAWVNVGAASFATGGSISLAFEGSTPYVAFSEAIGGGLSVMEFDGTSWKYVGSSSFSSSGSDYASIAFDGTTPYVAFQDFGNSSKVTVMSYNGSTWSNVGSPGFSAGSSQYVSLAFEGSTPYVAFKDGGNSSKASVMKFDGSSWVNVGQAGFSSGLVEYTTISFHNSTPYVGYSDDGSSDAARVDYFDGSAWVQLGSNLDNQSSFNDLTIKGDTVYVTYVNGGSSFSPVAYEYALTNCSITSAGLSNIQCNDNGTPNDGTDDYITFDLNPTGSNLDTVYTVTGATLTPNGGNYGTVTSYQTNPGTAGSGDLNLTIIDGADSNCTFAFTVTDPGTCTISCNIASEGLSNIQCNNNGTPSDDTDDYITFDLNPTGTNLGANYTVTGATLTPSGGNYGSTTSFQTNPGTAGNGTLNLTIVDGNDSNCTFAFTVNDPGTCSNSCSIASAGLSNIQCNNNGTPSDDTDDYITFDLNPTGTNLGGNYTVTGATLTPSGGNYGGITSFQTNPGTAGNGNLNLTIVDGNNSNCTFAFTVNDPGTCSNSCNITSAGLSNIQCNNNGTPSDDTDDYITFDLNPTGFNLGANYTVTGAALTPSGGNYGSTTSFQTNPGTAGNGNLNLTIVDGNDSNCTFAFTVNDPGTCSNSCNIASAGLSNIQCNNNGTPSDDTDDYITFDLNPTGTNLGGNYTVTGATLTPSGGNYGGTTSFQTNPGTAGNGNLNLTIVDGNNSNCTFAFTVSDPGTCSNSCNIASAGLSNIQCNNNGTPSDDTDDYITFDLTPTGTNLGANYTVTGATLTPIGGNYGGITSFQTNPGTAGNGNLNLTIVDGNDSNCTFAFTVNDPGTCSNSCSIASAGLSNIQCNNNGTPSDDTDDYITFELNPTGTNLGGNYTVTGATLTPSGGNYGGITSFQTNPGTAGNGNLNLTIVDGNNSNCTFAFTVNDPGTCSDECELTSSGYSNLLCNNNGTTYDPSDDYFTFDLNPAGLNLSSSGYSVSSSVTVTPSSSSYGSVSNFQTSTGSAGGGNLTITITDLGDGSCTILESLIDPTPSPILANSQDPTTCEGNGSITIGGLIFNDTYNIIYDEGANSNTVISSLTANVNGEIVLTLPAGNYTNIRIQETVFGCIGGSLSTILSDPASPTYSVAGTDPSSCNGNDGFFTISGLNANQSFVVNYNDDGNPVGPLNLNSDLNGEIIILNLNPGIYSNIIVTNSANCSGNPAGITLNDPGNLNTFISNFTNPLTCGGIDGNITIGGLFQGNNHVVNYLFNGSSSMSGSLVANGNGEITLSNLEAGNYTDIIVTDNTFNCTGNALAQVLTDPASPNYSIGSTNNPSTCGGNDGSIILTGLNSNTSYEIVYNFNGTPFGPNTISSNSNGDLTISNLAAGNYTNIIATLNGCSGTALSATLNNPAGLTLTEMHLEVTCPGGSDGSIDLTVSGGSLPFVYDWDNDGIGDNDDSQDLSNLVAGTYSVTVTDGANCANSLTVSIQDGNDNTPPNAICQDLTVQLDGNNNATISPQQIDNGSTDNCGTVNLSLNISSFDCSNVGNNTVLLSVNDGNGNSSSCNATVTVEDLTLPIAICQDLTVEITANGSISITPQQVDNGSSDNCGTVNLSLSTNLFDCSNIGLNTITLTVDDGNGNSNTCTSNITVEDNIIPMAICQDISVDLDVNGLATITPNDIDNGSSDNCLNVELSLNIDEFNCGNVGANTVFLSVDDLNGNLNSCSSIVTIEDNLIPTAVCQDLTIQLDGNGNATINPGQVDAGSSDNCSISNLTIDINSFDCTNVGANTVTLTVFDVNGNSNVCSSSITVEENIPPIANCQNISVQLDASGNALISAQDIDDGSSDNCGNFTLSLNNTGFDCDDIGIQIVTLTVTDLSGNSDQCTANVIVDDSQVPIAVCQDLTIELDINGMANITPQEVDGGSSDNCGNFGLSLDNSAFGCLEIGNNIVTLTVTDDGGNSDQCSSIITIEDNTPPTAICQDVTVQIDSNGNSNITEQDIDGGSSDNCGNITLNLDNASFNCSNVGTNTVTLAVNDGNGNSSSCTGTVTVEDSFVPAAICQDITAFLDQDGVAEILPQDIDGGSSDNCGSVTLLLNEDIFFCSDIGTNTVTLTVDDGNGNSSSCDASVTIEDNLPPNPICLSISKDLDINGNATITAQELDGGSTDNCGNLTFSINNSTFDCSNVGQNTVQLTVSDDNGNSDVCDAIVTIIDPISPTAQCQNTSVTLDVNGLASITPNQIDDGSSDNCGNFTLNLDNSSFNCNDVGIQMVVLSVEDLSGNVSTCAAEVTVIDDILPIAICKDISVDLDFSGNASIMASDVDGGSTDNCGAFSLSIDNDVFTCDNIGVNTVTLTIQDSNGNADNCTADITVEDNLNPSALCLSVTVNLDTMGIVQISADDLDAGSTDNCGSITFSIDNDIFDCTDLGTQVITLTVNDGNGNSSSCSAAVIVQDNLAPTVNCQDLTVQLDNGGQATITAQEVDDGTTDNCNVFTLSLDNNSFDCDNVGSNTVVLTATDGSNNSANCNAIITVEESTNPIAVCQDISVDLDNVGLAIITPQQVDGGSSDNCSIASLELDSDSFDCDNIGTESVNLTVTDVSGNTNSCTAVITINDNSLPTAICQDVTVELDLNGAVNVDAQDINNGSSDNCDNLSFSLDITTFSCSHIGSNPVTLTVNDGSGNDSTCSATVTVQDLLSPTVICQDLMVQLNGSGNANILAQEIDNGSSDNCTLGNLSIDNSSFDCTNIGTNTVTLTASDLSGNSSSCSSTVTVLEDTPPTAICQNLSVFLDDNGAASITPQQVNDGSSDNCGNISLSLDISEFDCSNEGINTVTLTVTDGSSNTNTCTAQINVIDDTVPTAICQNITVTLGDDGTVTITAEDVDNGSFDNCVSTTISINVNTFSCMNVGANNVILTVDDNIGSANQCTAIVTVVDDEPPVLVCNDFSVDLNMNNSATVTTDDLVTSSSDNCGFANLSLSTVSFDCSNIGLNNVIVTAQDGYGNETQCTSVVTVSENIPPVANCKNATIQLTDLGVGTLTANQINDNSSDNCGQIFLSIDQDDFDCSNLGNNIVNLTVEDAQGNQSSCSAQVNVIDDLNPIAICKNITVNLDGNGLANILPQDIDDGSSDNCNITNLGLDFQNFNCNDVGSEIVTLVVTDQSGNSSECFGVVTIEDNLPPTAIAQDITVMLDDDGNASITASMVNNGSFDNCDLQGFSINQTAFTCDDVGDNEVILSVIDIYGNISTDTAIVNISETDPPIALSQDITVILDINGQASITPDEINDGSFDNCGIATLLLSIDSFDCDDIGDNSVILTVTDGYGNSSASIATVTVVDDSEPVITCPITYSSIDCQNIVEYDMPTVTDNCTNGEFTLIEGLESGSQFPSGLTNVTWQYADVSGNSVSCSFVVDAPIPLVISQIQSDPVLCNGGDDGSITIFPQGGIPNYTYLWSDGQMTQTASGLIAGDYDVTVTDSIGCEAIANIEMPEPPLLEFVLDSVVVDTNMTNSGAIYVTPIGGTPNYSYSWFLDGQVISNEEDPEDLAAGEYTIQITDDNGCIILSDIIIVDGITPTSEPVWAEGMSISPNPSTGKLFLDVPNLRDQLVIEVYNLIGQKIDYSLTDISVERFELDIQMVPSGIYLIQISASDSSITRKIMISK